MKQNFLYENVYHNIDSSKFFLYTAFNLQTYLVLHKFYVRPKLEKPHFWFKIIPRLFNAQGSTRVNIGNIHLKRNDTINPSLGFKLEFGIGQLTE